MSRPSVSRAMNLRKTSRRDILRAMGVVAGASAVGAVVGGPSAAEVIRESTAPEGHAPVGLRLHGHPAPARTHGWSWKLPPNLVRPNSGLRNNNFYVGQPVTFKLGPSARTYEVRDYFGEIVDHGPAGLDITVRVKRPGWYKLYIYGAKATQEWGDIVGGTTFVIFRKKPGFAPQPPQGFDSGSITDEPMHGVTGIGPEREGVSDCAKPAASIKGLEPPIQLLEKFYMPYDPLRHRVLEISFSNGTKDIAGVKKIVEHFKKRVQCWEPRNEPNFGSTGTAFAINEMKPFYEAVKSVDPNLTVLGPGTVTITPAGNMLGWIEDFLKAGGGQHIDAFSMHIYNAINGDLSMGREALVNLNKLLAKYGVAHKPKWQTEQGYFCPVYGSYQPRLQGRWTMIQMSLYEQFGIPKEQNCYFYDKSHGFWDFPSWFENGDGSLNPAASLMRVWAEEVYGTNFVRAYNFGQPGNNMYVGSLFAGPNKRVAIFQSAGVHNGHVMLKVTGGGMLKLVSSQGVESKLAVRGGVAILPVPELPVYVELTRGQDITVEPTIWGPNLALQPGVSASTSPPAKQKKTGKNNDISKLYNGVLENWYYAQGQVTPWNFTPVSWPCWIEMRLPKPTRISRVVVFACVPWQGQGTLLNYELQYENHGHWITLDHINKPTKTFGVFTPNVRTTVDSFFDDHCIFPSHFKPVTTSRIRLLVHDATWGGGASEIIGQAGGQSGPHWITLREIEIYS